MRPQTATATLPAREPLPNDPAVVVRHVARELRHPLGTIEQISHYLNMVLPRTEAKARRQLTRLQEEVRQVHWIMADALRLLEPVPVQCQPLDLTETVSKNLSEWCPAEGAGLMLRTEADLPLVPLDLEHFQTLLRDTIVFFSRIAAPGRSIVLRTYRADDEVRMEVNAATREYSAEDTQALFKPFASHFPDGAGLSLASARKIAEALGARVEVTCDPPRSFTLVYGFRPA